MNFWPIAAVLIALAVGFSVWGIFIERYLFTIREEERAIAILPIGARPIRVLHISDFHFAPWQRRKQRFVQDLGSLDIDLVINTGDNLGHRKAVPLVLDALLPLLKKPGAFANGSNDYFAPTPRNPLSYLLKPSERVSQENLPTEQMVAAFEKAGWINLNNRAGNLNVNGSTLRLVGVDDRHENLAKLETVAENAKTKPNETAVGVTHAPYLDVIKTFADANVELLFAGHTHGGQVCLPGFGALVTNCDLPRKAARGLSAWPTDGKQLWLNVCAGLGHSIFAPVRFACRPEVRIVTLVAKI